VDPWTPEHRQAIATIFADEVQRRGGRAQAARAASVHPRTLKRIEDADVVVNPDTIVTVAEQLGLPEHLILPPRSAYEKSQLDRIEAALNAVLARLGELGLPTELPEAPTTPAPQGELARRLQASRPTQPDRHSPDSRPAQDANAGTDE